MKNNSKLTVNPVSSAFELRANNEIQCKSTMRGMYLPPTATVGIVDGINMAALAYDRIFFQPTTIITRDPFARNFNFNLEEIQHDHHRSC